MAPLFIRSTDKPLVELAKQLYEFCKRDYAIQSPEGDVSCLELPDLLEGRELSEFVDHFGNDSAALIGLLSAIATRMPSTLALIIDQAEEVLTVDRSEAGEAHRNRFFSFLARLEPLRLDIKLLLAMRSEKFADFHTAVERLNRNFQFRTYGLQPLTERQMVEAVLRPTSEVASAGGIAPFEHYGFSFESGLVRKIVHDVLTQSTPGGATLVLQLLCDRLYTLTKPPHRNHWTITRRQYDALGGVQVQVLDGVDTELRRMAYLSPESIGTNLSSEVFKWKQALQILISPQADGTVVTVLKSREELAKEIKRRNCRFPVDKALAYLCMENVRILKREYVLRVGDAKMIECYSLAHDAIALALKFWDDLFKGQSAIIGPMARSLQTFAAVSSAFAVAGTVNKPAYANLWLLLFACGAGAAIGGLILPRLVSSSFVETCMWLMVKFLPIELVTRLVARGKYFRLATPELYALYQHRIESVRNAAPRRALDEARSNAPDRSALNKGSAEVATRPTPASMPADEEVSWHTHAPQSVGSEAGRGGDLALEFVSRASAEIAMGASSGSAAPIRSGGASAAHGGRQLVLLCDGTNNNLSGRHADTHVVLVAELLRLFPDPNRLVYYDPGVEHPGQLPGTTFVDRVGRANDRMRNLAFGRGLYDNVAEGYRFLMANWRPGDQIFLFGFSRGAFTARSIGGMVNAFGIVDSHQDTLVSSLVATHFSKPSPAHAAIREQAARLFGQKGRGQAWPEVHFLGLWDAVASVGMPPFGLKITARPTLDGKHFRHVRQALALDEQRAQFEPCAFAQDDGPFRMADWQRGDILQCWFRGSHCDVGGGNAYPYSELSRVPFGWLVSEAIKCGLNLPGNAQHAAPASESDVLQLLPVLDPHPPQRHAARINSATRDVPLWALTGLKVRDTLCAEVERGMSTPVKMQAHPSVMQWRHSLPWRTAWSESRDVAAWGRLLIAFVLLAAFQLMAGWALASSNGLLPPLSGLGAAFDANLRFQLWQLSLPFGDEWNFVSRGFQRPGMAVVLNACVIGVLANMLAPWVCRAFARHAGLINVGERPPIWLNRAGWALPLAVGAAICELFFTNISLFAIDTHLTPLWLPRLALLAASLTKVLAFLAVGGLILTSRLAPIDSPSHAASLT